MTMIETIKSYLTDEELRMFDCGVYPPFYHTKDVYFIEGRFVRVPDDAKRRISACNGKYVYGRDKVNFFFGPVTWQTCDRTGKSITWKSDISDKLWDAWWRAADNEIRNARAKRQFSEDKELAAAIERAKADTTKGISFSKFLIAVLVILMMFATIYTNATSHIDAEEVQEIEYTQSKLEADSTSAHVKMDDLDISKFFDDNVPLFNSDIFFDENVKEYISELFYTDDIPTKKEFAKVLRNEMEKRDAHYNGFVEKGWNCDGDSVHYAVYAQASDELFSDIAVEAFINGYHPERTEEILANLEYTEAI